jgi:hypothetical protein
MPSQTARVSVTRVAADRAHLTRSDTVVHRRRRTQHNPRRGRTATPRASTSGPSDSTDDDLASFERAWKSTGADLSLRWGLINRLFAFERRRAGLDENLWRLGWHAAKSYVGITYLYDDDETGTPRGDVFVSKYLCIDPSFDNALGCLRHELAHCVAGPKSANHGADFKAACEKLDCPKAWRSEKTGAFYSRPTVQMLWAKHDLEELSKGGKFATLPAMLYEKNVWSAAQGGDRTVFRDGETGTTLDSFQMYDLMLMEAEQLGR